MSPEGTRRRVRWTLGAVAAAALMLVPAGASATADHQDPPLADNAGTLSKPVRLVAVIPTADPHAGSLRTFAKAIPASDWLAALETAYPVGPGAPADAPTKVLMVHDLPGMNTQDRTVGSYQDYLFAKAVGAGIGKDASRQTLYLMFIPCMSPHGMDSFGCSSHHPRLNPTRMSPTSVAESTVFTAGDSMAVVLGAKSALADATVPASHELAEAFTNTNGVGQWRYHSDHPDDPWIDASAWVRDSGTIETADLAAGSAWYEVDPTSHRTFKYERVFATFRAEQGFNDWMVPTSPFAQYNVSDARGAFGDGWHRVVSTAGPTVSVRMTAWAEGHIGDFTLTASIRTSGGDRTKPCTLPKSSWTVHDGSTFRLKVDTRTLAPGQHLWCGVQFKSVRSGAAAHDDASHLWVVGILVTAP